MPQYPHLLYYLGIYLVIFLKIPIKTKTFKDKGLGLFSYIFCFTLTIILSMFKFYLNSEKEIFFLVLWNVVFLLFLFFLLLLLNVVILSVKSLRISAWFPKFTQGKTWSFPFRVFLVNGNKSAVFCQFVYIY